MKEKVKNVIELIDNTDDVIKIKKLKNKINNNEEYLKLMNEFIKNKDSYVNNNSIEEEIIKLREKLFSIEELQEYLKIQNNLRLLSININNIILDVLN